MRRSLEQPCSICKKLALLVQGQGKYLLYECPHCGHCFYDLTLTNSDKTLFYSKYRHSIAEDRVLTNRYEAIGHKYASLFSRILRALRMERDSVRLFDFGAGLGYFLQAISPFVNNANGIEISEFESKYARDVVGMHVVTGDLLKLSFENTKYNVITSWEVFEHLDNPQSYLAKLSDMLTPDGILIISTPNNRGISRAMYGFDWRVFIPPEHLNLFSRRSMKTLLIREGLSVIKLYSENFDIGYSLGRLIRFARNLDSNQLRGNSQSISETTQPERDRLKTRLLSSRIFMNISKLISSALRMVASGDTLIAVARKLHD